MSNKDIIFLQALKSCLINVSLKAAKEILKEIEDPNVHSNENSECCILHILAFGNHLELAKWFIQTKKPNIDIKDRDGNSPLHIAAEMGNVNFVKFLIEKGAKPNSQNQDDYTPLHHATLAGNKQIVKILIRTEGYSIEELSTLLLMTTGIVKNYNSIGRIIDCKINKMSNSSKKSEMEKKEFALT